MRKFLFFLIFLLTSLFLGEITFAQLDIQKMISDIITLIRNVAITGAGIIILIGAYFMVTSVGDPAGFEKGKKTIMFGILGLVIILLAEALANAILGAIK